MASAPAQHPDRYKVDCPFEYDDGYFDGHHQRIYPSHRPANIFRGIKLNPLAPQNTTYFCGS